MNCPDCNAALVTTKYKGIPVDSCKKCLGMWLDATELEELEDKAFYDGDNLKGTLIFGVMPSNRPCPKCGVKMQKFNYRFYDLELETCDQKHGYWLDKGEEKRILELMKNEEKDLHNKIDAENKWAGVLQRLRTPSFIDKLTYLLKR